MPVVVQDNSIGQALGALGGALLGDPKAKWEAEAYKQKIANMQADTAKAQLENLNLQRQEQAQSALVQQFNTMFQPGNFNVPETVEAPRPTLATMGPMPGMHNPEYDMLGNKLAFARAAATNAIRRGGNPGDALDTAYAALGQGDILVNGIPTDEAQARQAQTMLTGQIPDAKTPLTEDQRQVMQTETDLAKLKEAVSVSKDGVTYLSPAQGATMNIQPNDQGQYILRGPGDAPAAPGMLSGNAVEVQAANALFQYQRAVQNNQPVTPDMLMTAKWAWNTLYGPKKEQRAVPGGGMEEYTVYPSVPQGFSQPGAEMPAAAQPAAPGAPAMQPRGPQSAWGPQAQAPAPVTPVTPAQPSVQVPQVQPGQPAVGGQTTVTTLKPGRPEAPPEHVIKKGVFTKTMNDSLVGMKGMLASGYKPNKWDEFAKRAKPEGPGATNAALQMAFEMSRSPEANQFDQMAYSFVNAVLRDESGAAVPEIELSRYLFTLVPSYLDKPEQVQAKLARMQGLIDARASALDYNSFLDMMRQMRDQDVAAGGGAPPVQPQQQQSQQVDPAQARAEAVEAIAKIDASNLPSSEKERRKAEVQRRMNAQIGVQ